MPKWIHFCQLLGRRVRRIPVRYPRFRGDMHVNSRGCREGAREGRGLAWTLVRHTR